MRIIEGLFYCEYFLFTRVSLTKNKLWDSQEFATFLLLLHKSSQAIYLNNIVIYFVIFILCLIFIVTWKLIYAGKVHVSFHAIIGFDLFSYDAYCQPLTKLIPAIHLQCTWHMELNFLQNVVKGTE